MSQFDDTYLVFPFLLLEAVVWKTQSRLPRWNSFNWRYLRTSCPLGLLFLRRIGSWQILNAILFTHCVSSKHGAIITNYNGLHALRSNVDESQKLITRKYKKTESVIKMGFVTYRFTEPERVKFNTRKLISYCPKSEGIYRLIQKRRKFIAKLHLLTKWFQDPKTSSRQGIDLVCKEYPKPHSWRVVEQSWRRLGLLGQAELENNSIKIKVPHSKL